MKLKLLTFILTLILLMLIVSCNSSDKSSFPETKKDKVITSTDGKVQVTIQDDWNIDEELSEEAIIKVSNPSKEKYLMVFSESKVDFAKGTTIENYSSLVLEGMKQNITNISISSPDNLKVNNLPAIQHEIKGEVDKLNIVYLVTTVQHIL